MIYARRRKLTLKLNPVPLDWLKNTYTHTYKHNNYSVFNKHFKFAKCAFRVFNAKLELSKALFSVLDGQIHE